MLEKIRGLVFDKIPSLYLGIALLLGTVSAMFGGMVYNYGMEFNPIVIFIGFAFFEALLIIGCKLIFKASEKSLKKISISLLGLFLIGLILSACLLRGELRSDLYTLQNASYNYLKTGTWNNDLYFSKYPFQRFYGILIVAVYKIEMMLGINDIRILPVAIMVLMTFFSAYFAYKTVKKLVSLKAAVVTLVMIVLNPVFYLFVTHYYNDIPGMFFSILVIYLATKDKLILSLLLGVMAGVGYSIRATVAIAYVAVVLGFIFLRKTWKSAFAKISVSLFGLVVSVVGCKLLVSAFHWEVYSVGFPVTHWLMMGLTEDGDFDRSHVNYTLSFATKSERTKANLKFIANWYSKSSILDVLKLFYSKAATFLGAGMGRTNELLINVTDYNKLWDYTVGDKKAIFCYWAQVYRAGMLFNGVFALGKMFKSKLEKLYPLFVYAFGYVLFYTFWEANNRYLMTALPSFCIIGAIGLCTLCDKISLESKEIKLIKFKLNRKAVSAVLACLMVAFTSVLLVNSESFTKVKHEESIISATTSNRKPYYESKECFELNKDEVITQSFKSYRDFNRIKLKFNSKDADGKAVYKFEILDDNGNALVSQTFSKKDIKKSFIHFKFDNIKGKRNLTIRLSTVKSGKKNIAVVGISTEKQKLYYNGQASNNENNLEGIYFNAYKKVNTPTYSKKLYFSVIVLVDILFMIPIVILLGNGRKKKEFI